jgi:putative inorganic carbon (HCO3(-)) transporter
MLVIFLCLIFVRPFISSLAFAYLNAFYSQLLLAFLALWLMLKGLQLEPLGKTKFPLLLFSLALVISVIFSPRTLHSLRESYKYASGILIFIIVASFREEQKNRLLKTLILAGFIISLIGLYQYCFGFSALAKYLLKRGIPEPFALDWIARRRVYLPFITPNILAGYLAIVIFLDLQKFSQQRYYRFLLIPLCATFLLTKSLGAFASFFASLLLYFYLGGRLKKLYLSGLLGTFLIFTAVIAFRQFYLAEHTHPLFSATMRLSYWKDTLELIRQHPLVGIGLGNFNLPQSRYAHNLLLQLWAETGLLGLISFLWLVIAVLKYARKNKGKEPALLLAAAFVFFIHNFVDFSFFLPEASLIWWAIIGFIV